MTDLMHKVIIEAGKKRALVLEEHIKLHIQPKPRLLPKFLWYKILKRVLVMELR